MSERPENVERALDNLRYTRLGVDSYSILTDYITQLEAEDKRLDKLRGWLCDWLRRAYISCNFKQPNDYYTMLRELQAELEEPHE